MKVMKTKEIEEAYQDWEAKNKVAQALDSYDRRQKEYRQLEKAETVYVNLVEKQAKIQAEEFATSKGFSLTGAKVVTSNSYPSYGSKNPIFGISTQGYYDSVFSEAEMVAKLKEIAKKEKAVKDAETVRKAMIQSVEKHLKNNGAEFEPSIEKQTGGYEYDRGRIEYRDDGENKIGESNINITVNESWRAKGTPCFDASIRVEGISEEKCAELFLKIQQMWKEAKK